MDMSHLVACTCARNAQIHDHTCSLYRLGTLPEYEQYASLCPYEMHKLCHTWVGFAHQFCQYLHCLAPIKCTKQPLTYVFKQSRAQE